VGELVPDARPSALVPLRLRRFAPTPEGFTSGRREAGRRECFTSSASGARAAQASVAAETQGTELEELARDVEGFLAERPRFVI
jgi:hypothetical protein